MTYKTIQVAYESGIATITLNRPEKRNAISFELIDDLLRGLKEVESSDAIVLILTGAGKAFSSGMDLDNLKVLIGRSPEQNLEDSQTMVRLFRSLYEFPKVTIAAVNGPAIAGGTGLALLCDFTLAVPEAKFGYTEVRIGFVPAIVSTFLLRQVGEKQARDLLLTGRIIDAEEAARMGLIKEIVEPENLLARARELAALLLENSPASLRATKQLLNHHARAELDRQIEAAVRENAAVRTTADFREGVTLISRKTQTSVEGQMNSAHPQAVHETRLRVRYAETDQMGVVYHANHFIWFEVGRVELLRQMGFSYRDMEDRDHRFIAVAEAKCRYRTPVRYDEEVLVRTKLLSVRDSLVQFGYELRRAADGLLLAEGETTHIVTDRDMKIAVLPERYLKTFRASHWKTGREKLLNALHINGNDLTLEAVYEVAPLHQRRPVLLSAHAREAVDRARTLVDEIVASNKVAYAITTGVGKLSDVPIAGDQIRELQVNLVRSHAAGVGEPLSVAETRAMMLLRANSLAKGYSGVRAIVIDTLCEMLNRGVTPFVPSQGSVGASGDLAPLAHLALALIGEGECFDEKGARIPSATRLKRAQIKPLVLEAKESISLINGTQGMLAVGTLALLAPRDWWIPPTCWAGFAATRSREPTRPSMNAFTKRARTADR
jgi:methylglutaconyl-CoA hydratase